MGLIALRTMVNIQGKTYEDVKPLLLAVCQTLMTQAKRDGDIICEGVLDNYGPLVGTWTCQLVGVVGATILAASHP